MGRTAYEIGNFDDVIDTISCENGSFTDVTGNTVGEIDSFADVTDGNAGEIVLVTERANKNFTAEYAKNAEKTL